MFFFLFPESLDRDLWSGNW